MSEETAESNPRNTWDQRRNRDDDIDFTALWNQTKRVLGPVYKTGKTVVKATLGLVFWGIVVPNGISGTCQYLAMNKGEELSTRTFSARVSGPEVEEHPRMLDIADKVFDVTARPGYVLGKWIFQAGHENR